MSKSREGEGGRAGADSVEETVWRSNAAIGRTMRAIRSRRGMSQQDLAEYLGAPGSQSQVSLWEHGKHRPSPETLRRIARLVDETLEIFQYPELEESEDERPTPRERLAAPHGPHRGESSSVPALTVTTPEAELLAFLAERLGWEEVARELVHQDLLTTAYSVALRERWGCFELTRLDRIRDRILDRGADE